MTIQIIDKPVQLGAVRKIAEQTYKDMAKAVVDVSRGVLAVGGELHADAEALLLDNGSKQADLWGINIYPDKPKSERIVFNSFINIRPAQGNRSMDIQAPALQEKIRAVVDRLVGG